MSESTVHNCCVSEFKPFISKWIIKPFVIDHFVELESSKFSDYDAVGIKHEWKFKLFLDGNSIYVIDVEIHSNCVHYYSLLYSILDTKGKAVYSICTPQFGGEGEFHHKTTLFSKQQLIARSADFLPNNHFTILCKINTNSNVINTTNALNLSEPNIKQTLMDDYGKLFETKKYSDVIIKLKDDSVIKAHKAILTARSDVFFAMFENEMQEKQENCVAITDIDSKVCEEMLRFIYTGKVSDLQGMAEELLAVADKYNLNDLKIMCENYFVSTFSVSTEKDKILFFADRYRLSNLKKQIKRLLFKNCEPFKKSSLLKKMSTQYPDLLIELLKDNNE